MTIFEKLGAGQPGFNTETQVGEYIVEYPFGAAEPTCIIVRAPFEQFRPDYTRPAANTTLSYGARTLYFVDDQQFVDLRASVVRWTRVWASVPASFYEPEGYVYQFPGFTGSNTFGTAYAVSGISASGANYILSTAASSGIAAGDVIHFSISYTRGGQKYTQSFNAKAVATTNSSQITIVGGLLGSGSFTAVSGTAAKSIQARPNPATFVVGSLILNDFALSDPASLDTDLPLIQPFNPISNTGVQVTVLTSATSPTASDYATLTVTGGQIVIECIRRRWMGNIFQRSTRSVPAT